VVPASIWRADRGCRGSSPAAGDAPGALDGVGRDWTAAATARSVVDTVAPGLRGGATVLLHDADHAAAPGAWRATVAALPRIADLVAARGLVLGPLRDHGLQARRGEEYDLVEAR
jgi:peptidoglycan-N-acetylglucosamine deacetylase